MTPEELQEIRNLLALGISLRAVARKLGRDPKTIRRILGPSFTIPQAASKLEPFASLIQELAGKDLFAPRILRELKERGYRGSLTILKNRLRKIRGSRKVERQIVRRFETDRGEEGQCDWSPYRVKIGGTLTLVHCFSMILAFSRMLFVRFFRDEKLPTLLWAHQQALSFFGGCPRRLVYDNCTTVTLGRSRGKILWHPTFLEFSRQVGFEPMVCRPYDPDRKGKVERPFFYLETDFLRGSEFDSWDDFNAKAQRWLDTVANVRLHSTTHRHVHEAFAEEKPFLIRLPELMPTIERRETRKVQSDGMIAVNGSYYPVPAKFVGRYVTVKISPVRVEVVDSADQTVVAYPVPERPTRLPALDGTSIAPSAPPMSRPALELAFLARFPAAEAFLEGLKRRMNALTPIHLRLIERLVNLYGEKSAREAIDRAESYGNYNATAVQRILEKMHPDRIEEPPPTSTANPAALGALDDMESGTPADYTLDTEPPQAPPQEGNEHDPK